MTEEQSKDLAYLKARLAKKEPGPTTLEEAEKLLARERAARERADADRDEARRRQRMVYRELQEQLSLLVGGCAAWCPICEVVVEPVTEEDRARGARCCSGHKLVFSEDWRNRALEAERELAEERAARERAERFLVDEQQLSRSALADLGSTKAKLAMAESELDREREVSRQLGEAVERKSAEVVAERAARERAEEERDAYEIRLRPMDPHYPFDSRTPEQDEALGGSRGIQVVAERDEAAGERMFPVLYHRLHERAPGLPSHVPWSLVAPNERKAMLNHGGQTLERLAQRGGLSPLELYAVVSDRGFKWPTKEDDASAVAWLRSLAAGGFKNGD